MPQPVLPDPLELAIQGLLGQPLITALVAVRIADRIPDVPVWPRVVAGLVTDDEGRDPAHGFARVQCTCWGEPGPAGAAIAHSVARAVRATARDLIAVWPAGRIFGCTPTPISTDQDPTTGRGRALLDLLIDYA